MPVVVEAEYGQSLQHMRTEDAIAKGRAVEQIQGPQATSNEGFEELDETAFDSFLIVVCSFSPESDRSIDSGSWHDMSWQRLGS